MATLSDLRTRFRQYYPEATDEFIDVCLEHAIKEASLVVPGAYQTSTISLAAGTPTYGVPSDLVTLLSARYDMNATQRQTLKMVSQNEVERALPDYREQQPGVPRYIWLEATGLTLHPTPPETTSGGYPVLKLFYISQMQPLVNPSDPAPGIYALERWLLAPALEYYASARVPQHLDIRRMERIEALNALQAYAYQRGLDLKPKVRGGLQFRRRV